MNAPLDPVAAAELQHDQAQAASLEFAPVGDAREDWINHHIEQKLRRMSRQDATDLLVDMIARDSICAFDLMAYAADCAEELIGDKVVKALFAHFQNDAEAAFADNDWTQEREMV